jgi:hypothetical protein
MAVIGPTPRIEARQRLAASNLGSPTSRFSIASARGQTLARSSTSRMSAGRTSAGIAWALHLCCQFLDSMHALGCYDAELGGLGAQSSRKHCTLAHKQLSRALQHEHRLALDLFDRNKDASLAA